MAQNSLRREVDRLKAELAARKAAYTPNAAPLDFCVFVAEQADAAWGREDERGDVDYVRSLSRAEQETVWKQAMAHQNARNLWWHWWDFYVDRPEVVRLSYWPGDEASRAADLALLEAEFARAKEGLQPVERRKNPEREDREAFYRALGPEKMIGLIRLHNKDPQAGRREEAQLRKEYEEAR